MQVTIEINDRQALPVRAIPLLTYWEVLSPDVCANAFAGDECTAQHLEGLPTYRLDDKGEPQPVSALEWANYHVRALDACSARINATQSDHEVGYQQWRSESLGLLPAGVFVWRDEFESAFLLEYGPESMRARFAGADYEQDRHRLNFDPQYGPRNDWKTLVMEGFERVQPQATVQVPGVTDSAGATTETKEQRQDRRLQACIDAGLPMNTRAALSRLPDGVGDVADLEGVTRQAFSTDVKAALKRRESAIREGATVHRA